MNTTVASWTRHSMRLTYFWGFVSQSSPLEPAHSMSGSDYKVSLDEDLSPDTSSSIDTDEDNEDGEEEDGWNISILEHISS